jgi:hypothetical protein
LKELKERYNAMKKPEALWEIFCSISLLVLNFQYSAVSRCFRLQIPWCFHLTGADHNVWWWMLALIIAFDAFGTCARDLKVGFILFPR